MRAGLEATVFSNVFGFDYSSFMQPEPWFLQTPINEPVRLVAALPVSGGTAAVASAQASASTTVLDEGFETDGNGTRYTTSTPEFSDGTGDFFTRTDGSNIGSFYSVTGFGGSFYFAGMDIDGEGAASTQTLSFTGLDISGLTNLQFAIDVAEDDDAANQDWDADTALIIEYQIDGGGFQNLLAFEAVGGTNTEPAQDTDFDGVGDGTALSSIFQTFSAAIAGTGSSLDIRITFANLDAGDEDVAIDNVRVTGEAAFTPTTIFSQNFDDFRGAGFAPEPVAGQLDSDIYRVIGMSDGNTTFGGTHTSGDFARGADVDGGVTTGGVYAFEVGAGSGDYNIGFQPGGTDATPGSLDIVITNTGDATDTFDIAYNIEFNNDQARANSLNLQVSTDGGTTFTSFSAFDFVTPEVADGNGFTTEARSGTITLGSTIANGESFILRFATDDVGGSGSRDEIAIDDITVTTAAPSVGEPEPQPGSFSIDDVSLLEGNSGATEFTFTVTRTGGSDGEVSVDFVTIGNSVNLSDFFDPADGSQSGTLVFADGETSKTVTYQINGDTEIETNEVFTVNLRNPTGGATIDKADGIGTIINDDQPPQGPAEVFVNEIHYDNAGGDVGEGIEIAGPAGTDLAGWQIVFYNGNGGGVYDTLNLSGVIPDQDDGYGTLGFARSGLQNGAPDGLALVNAAGQVVQFLSYEGTLTATDGPAVGLTSEDIGVAEDGGTPAGFSLQLSGTGTFYDDFTWEAPRGDNFGAVNTGQDFVAANPNGTLFIDDASVVEGDSGTSTMTFNVFRIGGSTGAVSADYTVNLGTGFGNADALDLSGPLSGTVSFADGETFKTITVDVVGDVVGEPGEAFEVALSNPTGGAEIRDGSATGTILNDDPVTLQIGEIQGAGHTSVWVGNEVTTTGVVTAIAGNGFYMQDADGDGDDATSDAIFVFTGATPTVAVGDGLTVTGTVGEFRGGNDPSNLTVTQLSDAQIAIDSTGNALPDAIVIGPDGITPPTETIDDDDFTSFDPATDGIDFWESLEGMLVTVQNPVAVDSTNGFGELWTAASDGAGNIVGSNVSDEGLLVIDGGAGGLGVFNAGAGSDFNPERIQIEDATLNGVNATTPVVTPGTVLNDVTGIVSYGFGNFEVLPTAAVTVAQASTNIAETTTLVPGAQNQLSIATYNVLNLDINDADGDDDVASGRFDQVAFDIGVGLQAPDIVVLQEVQDDSGSANDGTVSAQLTLEALAQSIFEQTGIQYSVLDNPFVLDGQTGGQPGGNIRVAFLYRDDRVDLDEASVFTITDDTGAIDAAFNNTRVPLGANFTFNGETVTVIGNHFTSKIGSDTTFSAIQPPANAGALARAAQAAAVNAFIDQMIAQDADAKIAVAGDFNEFQFEEPMQVLTGELDFDGGAVSPGSATVLENLTFQLDEDDRFSVLFEGNAQALDHILATSNLATGAQIDAVHLNTPIGNPGSDHDPMLAIFTVGALDIPGTGGSDAIEGTEGSDRINASGGNDTVNGNGGDDIILGGSGADTLFGGAGDDEIDGGSGNDVIGGGDGADTLTGGTGNDTFVVEAGKTAADADVITDFRSNDRIAIADADGRDIVIQQSGSNVEILADGVLVVTLLGAQASRVVNLVEYEGTPASIDAPSGRGRSRFSDDFDFDSFDFGGIVPDALPEMPQFAPMSLSMTEVGGTQVTFESLFGGASDGLTRSAADLGLDAAGRADNPWIIRGLLGDEHIA